LFSVTVTQDGRPHVWPAVGEGHIFTVNTVHALSALITYSVTRVLCVFQR